jgi:hypothetical protein
MTGFDPTIYPELRQLCGAYLNADATDDYGSIARALAAYRAETGAAHRRAALAELVRLRGTTPSHAAFAHALEALGCEVAFTAPADAHALAEAMLDMLAQERGSDAARD